MRIAVAIAAGAIEFACITVFLTVVIGWLAGAAGHLPL
jgi:hypothetical protein